MLRNSALIAGRPFLRTTQITQTRGATATANAVQISAVTKRSVAARRPSTSADHAGMRHQEQHHCEHEPRTDAPAGQQRRQPGHGQ